MGLLPDESIDEFWNKLQMVEPTHYKKLIQTIHFLTQKIPLQIWSVSKKTYLCTRNIAGWSSW